MKPFVVVILMAGVVFAGRPASAQSAGAKEATTTSPGAVSTEEREKAKKRLYPGGRDEESLQVQAQLPNPVRGQASEPEEASTDHD